jgi:hypothetical protein
LQVSQCCPERTVTVNTTRLAFINFTRVDELIPPGANVTWTTEAGLTPSATRQLLTNLAVRVLNQFAQAERIRADGEFGCDATLRRTFPPNYLDDSISVRVLPHHVRRNDTQRPIYITLLVQRGLPHGMQCPDPPVFPPPAPTVLWTP